MSASARWPSPRAAHCGCASACRRSNQSCSYLCLTLPHSTLALRLPARLDDARDLAAHRNLAQLVASEPELAVHAARSAGEPAPVAQPRRARVAGQLLQLASRRQPLLVG